MVDKKEKIVLITGASSDIGVAIVRELLDSHLHIVAQVYNNGEHLTSQIKHPHLHLMKANLGNAKGVEEFFLQVINRFNRIDVLINTVGPFLEKNILSLTPRDWEEQIHFNLNLPFYMSHFAKEYLMASQGHMINFTYAGVESIRAKGVGTAYSAAKTALFLLTKSLASALAPYKVRVNSIAPGLIEKGQVDELNEIRQKMNQEIPFGRPGTPEEVATVVQWLILSSPEYMTGANLTLSGGWEF